MLKKAKQFICLLSLLMCFSGGVSAFTLDDLPMWHGEAAMNGELGEAEEAQSDGIRSRSEVIREVKQRYNAEILRIELDEKRKVYKVRILMPNGKVRNITISARR